MDADIDAPLSSPKLHPIYHFDAVYFKVNQTLYKLPRRNLQYSTFFKDLFGILDDEPNPEQSKRSLHLGFDGEGDSDDHPIVLEGIEGDAFDSFLKVLYPRSVDEELHLTLSQWTSVLDIARMWGFEDVRRVAIKYLSGLKMDAVEKAYLAQKYEVKEWYEDAFFDVVDREEPLSLEEARKLGIDLMAKLAIAREQKYSKAKTTCQKMFIKKNASRPSSTDFEQCNFPNTNEAVGRHQLKKIVRAVFELEGRDRD